MEQDCSFHSGQGGEREAAGESEKERDSLTHGCAPIFYFSHVDHTFESFH